MSRQQGSKKEELAKHYLLQQGLRLVEQNFYCRIGEIDLIMWDANYLVFIEVRARSNSMYGGAIASVTKSKQQKIIKTASYFLSRKKWHERYPIRFDVLGFEGEAQQIHWLKNAFQVDY